MARTYTHNIAFRVTPAEYRKLDALRRTFPEMQWGEMLRWLIAQPDSEQAIRARIGTEPAQGGIDMSLPRGDR